MKKEDKKDKKKIPETKKENKVESKEKEINKKADKKSLETKEVKELKYEQKKFSTTAFFGIVIIVLIGIIAYLIISENPKLQESPIVNIENENLQEQLTANITPESQQIEQWEVLKKITLSLSTDEAFMSFGTYEGVLESRRYSVESDMPVDIYYTKSREDCNQALNELEFISYPGCQPSIEAVYEYTSEECVVASDSGLCVINRQTSPAKVSILIEQKL